MTTATAPAPVLAVRDLTVAFARPGTHASHGPAVDGVSFDLRPGRVLALVGESGSGKSTTAMSILRLLPAGTRVSGSVRLQGDELLTAGPAQLRRARGGRIGMIFQEPMSAFTPTYRVGTQVAEALTAHGRGADRAARTLDLLRSVGLRDPGRIARSFPHELSGGQLQRAMIAMAISCDPVALVADEPTTALDVTVQAGILELLRSLRDTRDTAVLLITHDMGVVADLADDVVVLRAGRVVESGPATTVFATPAAPYTRELLDAVPRLEPRPDADRPSPPPVAAQAQGVTIAYGGRGWGRRAVVAVREVSFELPRGATLGLVGESGSGKSTLGRAFAGLLAPQAGSITVGGVDLGHVSRRRLRAVRTRVGYVFQDPAASLNPRSTVGAAIAEPLRLHTRQGAAHRRARALELLDAVRLPAATIDRLPHQLSGGQRQRVAIARAIALNPTLLIADEPTSALDVSVQAHVLDLLAELQRELGFACLLISHDLAVVARLASTVVVLRAGRVVEAGPVQRVLTAPEQAYTRRLLAAAPVADPVAQRERRARWLAISTEEDELA